MFERLVITKHRIQRIFCCKEMIHEEYIQRWKDNDWNEGETRENLSFLEEEKRLYLEMFPDAGPMFGDEDDNTSINLNAGHNNDESEDEGAEALV
jgi:hypothetical protein